MGKQENLDFENWDKEDLIKYIKKHINNEDLKKVKNNLNTQNKNKNKAKREFDFSKCCYRYIALKIAYFGWNYQGFAAQAEEFNVSTIEGHLFEALKTLKLIQDRKTCHYSLCGRTDKGVSAFSQIVGLYVRSSLKSDKSKGIYTYEELKNLKKKNSVADIDNDNTNDTNNDNENDNDPMETSTSNDTIDNVDSIEEWDKEIINETENEMDYVNMLNRILPNDIRVLAWSPIKSSFNARYDCKYRKYHYFFSGQDLDIKLMQEACKKLEGHHDFRNFCKIDPTKTNKFQRTIYSCSIFKSTDISELCHQNINHKNTIDSSSSSAVTRSTYQPFNIYVFEIKGMAFLWHQVRCCMAILFLIGKHKETPDIIDKLFDVDDKKDKGKPVYDLAPEIPLVLVDSGYPDKTFHWINDKTNPENKNINSVNYIKNLSILLESWQNEAIKLSLISKLLVDDWNFQNRLNNISNDNENSQEFINILKFIQSANLDGWYNSKRMQKIPIKKNITNSAVANYIPLLKRKRCNSFNEALEKKKQKK